MIKLKVAIYIRTSTDDQNPQNQLNDCLSINKWEGYEVYEDRQSAWMDNKERIEFERLKKDIRNNLVNHLIIWDFDRLYRNRNKFKEFLLYLKAFKVNLHSFRQSWMEDIYRIPSPWNEIVSDLMINIYGHIAEDESKKRSDRVKIAQVKVPGKMTHSYKGNKWGRRNIGSKVDERILELHRLGVSIRKICEQVSYYDNSRNEHHVSTGYVHKLISGSQAQMDSLKANPNISQ